MNILSLLIYLSSALGTFNTLLDVATGFSASLLALAGCGTVGVFFDHGSTDPFPSCLRFTKKALYSFLVIALLAVLVPSRDTVYMIAASEIGEEALTSPEGDKLRTIISDKLDEIIEDARKGSSRHVPLP